jgi:hypothetical protein
MLLLIKWSLADLSECDCGDTATKSQAVIACSARVIRNEKACLASNFLIITEFLKPSLSFHFLGLIMLSLGSIILFAGFACAINF